VRMGTVLGSEEGKEMSFNQDPQVSGFERSNEVEGGKGVREGEGVKQEDDSGDYLESNQTSERQRYPRDRRH